MYGVVGKLIASSLWSFVAKLFVGLRLCAQCGNDSMIQAVCLGSVHMHLHGMGLWQLGAAGSARCT